MNRRAVLYTELVFDLTVHVLMSLHSHLVVSCNMDANTVCHVTLTKFVGC